MHKGDQDSKPTEMAVLCTALMEMAQQSHHKDQWSMLDKETKWWAGPCPLACHPNHPDLQIIPIFFSGTAILMGLHDPEDGGTILLKNISNYLPANTP